MSDRHGVLVIRMLELGDVLSIAVPFIRDLKRKGESEIEVLTHGRGAEILALAEPGLGTLSLPGGVWPDNILPAMESFLGVAEHIIGRGYARIINLDTAFMPCFLTRFLKDAGEPVEGNIISKSIADVIGEIEQQTLSADYVNLTEQYLQSTWFGMLRWTTSWWESPSAPEGGYPEFYLKQCCGLSTIDLDMHIGAPKSVDASFSRVAIAMGNPGDVEYYSEQQALVNALQERGIQTVTCDAKDNFATTLHTLRECDLLITVPCAHYWLAEAVKCPVVLISQQTDPRLLMPQYGNDLSQVPSPIDLADSIVAILKGES